MKKLLSKISISLIIFFLISVFYYLFLKFFVYNTSEFKDLNLNLMESVNYFFMVDNLNGKQVNLFSLTSSTAYYFLVNFFIASIFGITFGVILGKVRKIGYYFNFVINFFRVMPSIIFIVLFKYQFHLSNSYVYLVGAFASIWPIILNTVAGVEKVQPVLRESIKILGIKWYKELFIFTLPEAFPEIWSGMKVGLGISFLITITCEYLNSSLGGLGGFLISYETDNLFPLVTMCIILWIGFIGIIINILFEILESKLTWLTQQWSANE